MKHFLLTLLLTFIVGVCSAQTEHMKFKGVPMEGTLQTFTSKLKAKGFMPIDVQDGVSLFTAVPFRNLPIRIGSAYSNRLTLSREQSC